MGLIELALRWLWHAIFGGLGHFFLWLARDKHDGALASASLQELDKPLSDAELQRLAKWLARHQPHDGWLADIHALDGFLACVIVGPEPIGPGEWIGWMFKQGGVPADANRMLALMARHMNGIADQLVSRPVRYTPLIETHPQLASAADPLDAWCQGFMTATALRDRQWEKLLRKKKDLAAWVHPIWQRASAVGPAPASRAGSAARETPAGSLTVHTIKTAIARAVALREK